MVTPRVRFGVERYLFLFPPPELLEEVVLLRGSERSLREVDRRSVDMLFLERHKGTDSRTQRRL